MKSSILYIILLLFFSTLHEQVFAQIMDPIEYTGSIEILMGDTSVPSSSSIQRLTLLGCNTRIDSFVASYWGRDRIQTISNIPYGRRNDSISDEPYFISKYYLASPPVIDAIAKNETIYDIGLLTPDEFKFTKENDTQRIVFDYDTLAPMKVHYIPVEFDQSNCKFEYVPIKIVCDNFPSKSGLEVGASGIGTLEDSSRLFLPYPVGNDFGRLSTPLNCVVTILNDIIPYYKLSFEVDPKYCVTSSADTNRMCQSINLKEIFTDGIKEVKIRCTRRSSDEIPAGCK